MTEELLPPDSDLFESMRSIGYSLKTAVADIVDNSISAKASRVSISFESGSNAHVSIVDNGVGMSKDELRVAMKLAGKSPKSIRDKVDLGRFGLGLKTASLSQCRKLTVLTRQKGGEISCAQWDLDFVASRGDWVLRWLEPEQYPQHFDVHNFLGFPEGTAVVWEDLDQLVDLDGTDDVTLVAKFAEVGEHLRLVFHRFMANTHRSTTSIDLNEQQLVPFDPFLQGGVGVQTKPSQKIVVSGESVTVTPYILPNQNKMTADQRRKTLFGESLERTAGFYVYRNERLLVHGTWFRLTPRTPLAKLARVQVDFPPALDSEWQLGIMTSSVQPPLALRRALSQLVPKIVGESASVAKGVSRAITGESIGIWRVRELGNGECAFEISADYPLISSFAAQLGASETKKLESILRLIESQFPVNILYSRMAADFVVNQSANEIDILQFANEFLSSLLSQGLSSDIAYAALLNVEPIVGNPQLAKQIEERREEILKGAGA